MSTVGRSRDGESSRCGAPSIRKSSPDARQLPPMRSRSARRRSAPYMRRSATRCTPKPANVPVHYRVVGQAVFPRVTGEDVQPLDEGAFFTSSGFAPMVPNNDVSRYIVGHFAPEPIAPSAARDGREASRFQPRPDDGDVGEQPRRQPCKRPTRDRSHPACRLDRAGPRRTARAPRRAGCRSRLVTSVRRRKHELAVLKTFGFTGGQVRATIGSAGHDAGRGQHRARCTNRNLPRSPRMATPRRQSRCVDRSVDSVLPAARRRRGRHRDRQPHRTLPPRRGANPPCVRAGRTE